MSDTVTLIAGVLLTSVGLLALLPYLLNRGWQQDEARAVVAGAAPPVSTSREDPVLAVAAEDLEGLRAYLFSLRVTVSDVAADLMEAQDALAPGIDGETDGLRQADAA